MMLKGDYEMMRSALAVIANIKTDIWIETFVKPRFGKTLKNGSQKYLGYRVFVDGRRRKGNALIKAWQFVIDSLEDRMVVDDRYGCWEEIVLFNHPDPKEPDWFRVLVDESVGFRNMWYLRGDEIHEK